MSDTTYAVTARAESPTRTHVDASGHTLTVDVPKGSGGTDEGPSPVDFVLAGLAGCLNLTAHIVASEQDLDLEALEVDVSGPINLARLTEGSTDDRAGLKTVEVTLAVETDASEEALTAWREAVEARCPVSDIVGNATPLAVQVEAKAPTAA